MSWRLADYLVYGELWNDRSYSTHGYLALRGEEDGEDTVVRLELTGDCESDLRGKHVRFWPSGEEDAKDGPIFVEREHKGFQIRQVGPTGTMTANGWVRVMPCDPEEFMHRAKLGEPPPTVWVRRLYLEWFSQNGRMLIELPDPVVEECVREGKEGDEGDWRPLPHTAPMPEQQTPPRDTLPEITIVDAEQGTARRLAPWEEEAEPFADEAAQALQRELDREAAELDRALRAEKSWQEEEEDEASDETLREMELLDHCLEHEEGETLQSFLKGDPLPAADTLTDAELEAQLKSVLAELALVNVAFAVCAHYTPREAYTLLLEEILPKCRSYKQMIGTGFVQTYMTHEYCAPCDEEALANYENYQPQDSLSEDEDPPF
jgi:hypothetical protein